MSDKKDSEESVAQLSEPHPEYKWSSRPSRGDPENVLHCEVCSGLAGLVQFVADVVNRSISHDEAYEFVLEHYGEIERLVAGRSNGLSTKCMIAKAAASQRSFRSLGASATRAMQIAASAIAPILGNIKLRSVGSVAAAGNTANTAPKPQKRACAFARSAGQSAHAMSAAAAPAQAAYAH